MSKSTKAVLITSILLFVFSVSSFVLMGYQVNRQGEELGEYIAVLEAEKAQEDAFFRLQKIAEDTKEDRGLLQDYFLASDSDSIDFLNLVEEIAPESGVSLKTEGLDKSLENGVGWITINFSFSGSRDRVEQFLKILETLPYVLRVDNYEMTSTGSSNWQAKVNMRVQVLDYDK